MVLGFPSNVLLALFLLFAPPLVLRKKTAKPRLVGLDAFSIPSLRDEE